MREYEDWREVVHSTKHHTSVKRLKNANDHEQEIHAVQSRNWTNARTCVCVCVRARVHLHIHTQEEQSSELALLPPP